MKLNSRKKGFHHNQISYGTNAAFSLMVILLMLTVLIPLLLVISISFSSAKSIVYNGYQFFPSEFTLDAYKTILKMGDNIGRAYLNTIFYTVVTTVFGLFIMSMLAFVLSRKDFKARRVISFLVYFTTLFSGGMVPTFVLNVRYLHINNSIWVFILPFLVSAFDVIILRTFIKTSIPDSLFESAKLDGANDLQIYFKFVLPLSKAGLASVGLFTAVTRWNDWNTGMLYAENPKLVPIMTLLQRIQNNIAFLKNNTELAGTPEGMAMLRDMPSESVRMAISIISVLPLLVVYPFFQKYFVKGLTIGSVKE